jgi:hypothetical protein
MNSRTGPNPWPGCDTAGEAWKAYCEAWEHCFMRKDPRLRRGISDCRGRKALDDLDHNIRLVRADYAGELERAELPRLLRS